MTGATKLAPTAWCQTVRTTNVLEIYFVCWCCILQQMLLIPQEDNTCINNGLQVASIHGFQRHYRT